MTLSEKKQKEKFFKNHIPPPDDDPDYRYGDFRDEINDVERMRTIGGNHGTKNKEEKS